MRNLRGRRVQQQIPTLPGHGGMVRLGDRGETFVRDVAGPPGSVPVVLLHGWTWTAELNFAEVFGPLSARHRVLAPDVRMHGRAPRDRGFTLIDAGDDVIALLDELRVERAIVCGFSMGGGIAADVVSRYPDRVAGTVICGTAACYTVLARDRMIFNTIRALQPLATRGVDPRLGVLLASVARRRSPSLAARWVWARAELERNSLADIIAVARDIPTIDLRRQLLAASPRPSQYLLLTRDRVCRPRLQYELARLLGANIIRVDADHDLPVTDPQWYAELVVDAVSGLMDDITAERTYPA